VIGGELGNHVGRVGPPDFVDPNCDDRFQENAGLATLLPRQTGWESDYGFPF
jgi:hypothetical protein